MVSTGRLVALVLAAPAAAFVPLRRQRLCPFGLKSTRPSSFGFGGRDPQKLAEEGQVVFTDAVNIVRDVGLQATIRRTLLGQRALVETSLEFLRDLPSSRGSPFEALQSSVQIGQQLLNGDASGLEKYLKSLPPELAPRTLRKLFERLGATYIKLGQFIASSPTLFPKEYVLEFQKCLDQSPSVSFQEVRAIVEADLGRPLSDVFESFDETPLASASVAQVHGATLKAGGFDVVVKVQKPGVADTLKADLGFLAVASKILEFLAPSLGRLSLANIVTDLRLSMLGELDFTEEAANLNEFRTFLQMNALEDVATAPRPYPQASGKKTLTMERLRGVPLIDLEGIKNYSANPEQTLVNALNTWALSVVACPSFHADVHAGNLLVVEGGRVGFIDFGIVGRVPPSIWASLQALAVAVAGGLDGRGSPDYAMAARALVSMGATDSEVDVEAFARDLEAAAAKLDVVATDLSSSREVSVDDSQVAALAVELVGVADRNGVKLPREFGILLKQVLYFDRYTRLLAPDLDVMSDDRLETLRSAADAKKIS